MSRVVPFSALLHAGSGAKGSPPQLSGTTRAILDAVDPAAELVRQRDAGALVREARPALYLLELEVGTRALEGPVRLLLCGMAASAAPPLEESPPRPRSRHAEPALVLAADDHGVVRELLAEAGQRSAVVWQGGAEGARQTLRRIEPAAVAKRLQAALDEAPLRSVFELGDRGLSLTAVLPLSDPGLQLRPIHRALRGLETFREDTFLTLVGAYARIYELAEPLSFPRGLAAARERLATLITGHHAVLLVLPEGRGKILRFRQGLDLAHLKAAPRSPTLRSLDLALLNALVLRTVLGLSEPEVAGHPHVFPVEGMEPLLRGVESGTFQAGFALNPPPLWEVRAVIEAAAVLPARTLRVEPLPPPGLLFLDPED